MTEHRVHCWMAEKLTGRCRGTYFAKSFIQRPATTTDHYDVDYITIDIFPDEVLLEIFAFCLCERGNEEEWQTLVRVCLRWRSVVFGSPLSLNLRIVFTKQTCPEALDIWPAFPIIIRITNLYFGLQRNLVIALKHRDRICEIHVDNISEDVLCELLYVTQDTFPALTALRIRSRERALVGDSFLGGSAPSLRSLFLQAIGLKGLPKLLSSAPGLVRLHLVDMYSWYIQPEEMVDSLSSLTRLEQLRIHYLGPRWGGDASRRPPPLTRTVLPVLTSLAFSGEGEYFDYLFARTHFPLLKDVDIDFDDPVIFDVSQLSQFIGHTEAFDQAHILFSWMFVEVTLSSSKRATDDTSLMLSIRCRDSVWQLKKLKRDRRPFSPPLPTRDYFDFIDLEDPNVSLWASNLETRWETVLQLFTAVENLYLSVVLTEYVMFALQDNAAEQGVVMEVLPALQNIFIESLERFKSGVVHKAIEKFVAARELSGRPITVQRWVG